MQLTLEEVRELRKHPVDLAGFMTLGHAVLRRFEACPLPVVAACQGLCLAGGLELMLAHEPAQLERRLRVYTPAV